MAGNLEKTRKYAQSLLPDIDKAFENFKIKDGWNKLWNSRAGDVIVGLSEGLPGQIATGLKKQFVDTPIEFGKQMGSDIMALGQEMKYAPQYGMSLGYNEPAGKSLVKQAGRGLSMIGSILGPQNPRTLAGYLGFNYVGGTAGAALQGQSPLEANITGMKSALANSPRSLTMAGIGSITNPLIEKAGGGLPFLERNLIRSPLNVAEGILMDKAVGYETTPGSMLTDALVPVGVDIMQGGLKGKKVGDWFYDERGSAGIPAKPKGVDIPNKDLFQEAKKYKSADDLLIAKQGEKLGSRNAKDFNDTIDWFKNTKDEDIFLDKSPRMENIKELGWIKEGELSYGARSRMQDLQDILEIEPELIKYIPEDIVKKYEPLTDILIKTTKPTDIPVDVIDTFKEDVKRFSSPDDFADNMVNAYHGTKGNFDTFDPAKTGSHTDSGMWGTGHYFTNQRSIARGYANRGDTPGNVMDVYLDLKNPYLIQKSSDIPTPEQLGLKTSFDGMSVDEMMKEMSAKKYSDRFRDYLVERGYDGVIANMDGRDYEEYVAFYPGQIKTKKQLIDIFNKLKGK